MRYWEDWAILAIRTFVIFTFTFMFMDPIFAAVMALITASYIQWVENE